MSTELSPTVLHRKLPVETQFIGSLAHSLRSGQEHGATASSSHPISLVAPDKELCSEFSG